MCKALEEKYTQIQTLKIDTAKKLAEQKELNLTDKELEINASNIKKHEDKIKELQKKKEAFNVWIKTK
jgi:exonuclease SbcC